MQLLNQIEECVAKYIHNRISFESLMKLEEKCDSELDMYMFISAYRLIKYWKKYKEAKITKSDILSSFRNYLLLFQTSIELPGDFEIDEFNAFGLKMDDNGKCFCVLNTPQYLNEKIIEQAYMRNFNLNQSTEDYFLGVSPFIYSLTGFKYYKSIEQKIAVSGAINTPEGYTTMVDLPTGGGKSLITQSLAYQRNSGLTIVVVPTISLAIDQVRAAKNNIAHNTDDEIYCYYSGIKSDIKGKIFSNIEKQKLRLLFISPEALIKNEAFRKAIENANQNKYLKNIVIDESHIVIEWGTFFRVDYQCLEPWRNGLIKSNPSLKTILLSATFEKKAVSNLKSMFASDNKWIEIRCDKLRREPRFQLVKAKTYTDKNKKIVELLNYLPRPLVIYVTSPDRGEQVKQLLAENNFTNIDMFTGKTKSDDRERIIDAWAKNEIDTIIATSAFGVGVDKSDVRTVLHLYVPENPNEYYQQLGRGGRDGLPCLSIMCIEPRADLSATFNKIGKVLGPDKILGRWETMLNSPTSKRYMDTYTIDTSVKPNYNSSDEYAEDASKKDIQWNIYVLLLLRRNNLLRITDIVIIPETLNYMIRVEILNDILLKCDASALGVISGIREQEWKKSESDFRTMQNAIRYFDKKCWSEMFFKTYGFVSEYCGGCNNHLNIINTEPNRFPLVKRIDNPIKKVNIQINELLRGASEAMILLKEEDVNILVDIIEKGIDILLIEDSNKEKFIDMVLSLNENCEVNIMGFKEFTKLLEKNSYYFISGSAMILYDNNMKDMYRELLRIKKAEKLCEFKAIHVFEQDVFFSNIGKYASNIIDGPRLESYLIERMEKNV